MILTPHGRNHGALIAPDLVPGLANATDNFPLLSFKEIYATTGVIGLRLGDRAKELARRPVRIRGYMAPPIVDAADYFILTRSPALICPFCDPGSGWPDDVVLVQLERESRFVDPSHPIEVAGTFDIGAARDERTGTVRLVRLLGAAWHTVGS
jgi:hypothetical protein